MAPELMALLLFIGTFAILLSGYPVAFALSGSAILFAGLGILTGDGYVELGAMYGGLQIGFGIFCIMAALKQDLYRPGLTVLVVVIGGLALGRLSHFFPLASPVTTVDWSPGDEEYVPSTCLLCPLPLRHSRSSHGWPPGSDRWKSVTPCQPGRALPERASRSSDSESSGAFDGPARA